MGGFFYFILCGIVFSAALNIIFFTRKHIKTGETKIFSVLLIVNFISLLSELICTYIGYNILEDSLIPHIATKIYLICLITFILYMTLYIYVICYANNEKPKLAYYIKIKDYFLCYLVDMLHIMHCTTYYHWSGIRYWLN